MGPGVRLGSGVAPYYDLHGGVAVSSCPVFIARHGETESNLNNVYAGRSPEPLTRATCDNARIYVERFGPGGGRTVYLTLLNDTNEPQTGRLNIDISQFKAGAAATATG